MQIRKVLYAFFPGKVVRQILKIASLSYKTFSNFVTGQCLEAVILGTMFFVVMTILKFPYALLVGVVIACTALIPIFGAFIGCVVGTFLILVVNPMRAVAFVILFLVLQQIEGNLIYPHVVGSSDAALDCLGFDGSNCRRQSYGCGRNAGVYPADFHTLRLVPPDCS